MKRAQVIEFFNNIDAKWEDMSLTCRSWSNTCLVGLVVSGNTLDFNYQPKTAKDSYSYSEIIWKFEDDALEITETNKDYQKYAIIDYDSIDAIRINLW